MKLQISDLNAAYKPLQNRIGPGNAISAPNTPPP
jgi:hypothetical protein